MHGCRYARARGRARMTSMSLDRLTNREPASTEEPTPKPASAVTPIASGQRSSELPGPGAQRKATLLEYFAKPSPEMREVHAAWEAAVVLYGDEDSDAWVAALEDGSHPLCRVGSLARLA